LCIYSLCSKSALHRSKASPEDIRLHEDSTMHRFHTCLALLLALFGCAFAAEKPNVIVVLVDDLGATDLGFAGSDFYKTPHLDGLAKESVRFTTAYSACTVCSPTRAALLTGKYPARLRVTDWIPGHVRPKAKLKVPDWTQQLALEEVTLAEAFKAAGYATASVGKWHLGNAEFYPEKQGFDLNRGGWNKGQPPSYFSPYKIPTLEEGPPGEYLADREASEACRFIEANKERPFFLYVPCHLVHTPLQAKKELIEKYKALVKDGATHTNAQYAAMIESLDEEVGAMLKKLDELKLRERTVFVFTSDNGGLLPVTKNPPFRVGKGSAYEGGVRVPLLIRAPNIAPGVCATPAMTIDLYPTLLELCEISGDAAHNKNIDGRSLAPLLKNPASALERELFWHYPHYHPGGATPYSAMRAGDFRLVEFYEDGKLELYDLKSDAGEATDLATTQPDKVKELKQRLDAWRAAVGAQAPTPNPDYDPDAAKEKSKTGKKN